MAKEHIYLGNDFAETISFTPKPRPNTTPLPSRDVAQHASMLKISEHYHPAFRSKIRFIFRSITTQNMVKMA